jgi:predicted kinase
MPCKIEIKKNITEEIENLSEEAMEVMSLEDANVVADEINSDFGMKVISFKQDKDGNIKRTIKVPASLVQEYYDNELALEKEEGESLRPPAVVLPIGISGSGKSTWIKSLPEGDYTIVSPDEIRKELTGSISDQSRNAEVFLQVDNRINEAISNGEQVILDATNLNTKLRRQFIDSLRKNFPEVDVYYKLFPADPVISKQRIKKDLDNQVDRSAVPDDVIDRQVVMYTQAIQDIDEEDMIPFAEDVEQDDPFYYTRTEEQLALPKSEETIKFISTLATLKKVLGKKTVRLVSKETGESVSYDVITKKKSKIDPTPVYVLSELEKNKSGKIDPKDSKFKNAGVYAYLDFFMTNQDKELAIDNVISGKGLAVLNKLVDIGLVTATNARVESMIKAPGQQDNIYFYTSAPFEYNLNFLDDLALENSKAETKEAEAVITTMSNEEKNSMLQKMVENFLEKIGVKIQAVDVLRDGAGNILDGAAKASMLNGIIQVIEGKRTIDTLPEEAAHFFVEMIGEGHPLYIQMYNKITEYEVYQSTFEKYKDKPAYRNLDGTVNTDKIKKEAMGKLIAKHIIEMDPGAETESKLVGAINWWQKLWDYITSILTSTDNPFEEAAAMILLGETEELSTENIKDDEYYQLVDPLQGVLNDQDKITLDNTIDPRTGQKRHIYYYQGNQAKGSVTSVYVDGWLKKIFKTDKRSNVQKLIDLSKAEFGDIVHEQIQDIVKSWSNSDGTKKDSQSTIAPKVDAATYKKLNTFIQEVMNQYEPGTVFKSEVKIFDQKTNIAGSIDLLIVKPDGFVDIYDWKTQEIFAEQTDLKSYKEPMYRIQLENYRKILELQYGFTKFGKIRAIPMATQFNFVGGRPSTLKSLEIGNLDPTKIPEEKNYLLPVTLRTEITGDTQLDILIQKLYGVYDKIQKKRYSNEELFKKREELEQLRLAIRDVQLRNKLDKLVELGLVEFKKYTEKLNSKTLSGKEIPDALNILRVFSSTDTTFYDIRQEVLKNIDKEDTKAMEEFREVDERLRFMTSRVAKLITDIEEYRKQAAQELGEKNGIENLLKAEKKVGTLSGLFTSLSNISQKSFRLFSALLRRAQGVRDAKFDKAAAEMKELKNKFVAWASGKGGTEKGMAMMLDTDDKGNWNGNFLRKYNPEFKKLRNKAIEDGDTDWLVANQIFDEDETYAEAEKKQIDYFESVIYSSDEEKNKKIIKEKIKEWIDNHRVETIDGRVNIKALYNKDNRFLKPKEQWYTDKWKAMNRPENKPLKDVYEYFQKLLRQSERLGMLDKFSPHFIPSLAKDKMDQLVFGDIKGLFSTAGFFENLEVDSGSVYTPELDPTTGEVINRIPVYFVKDMGVKQEDGTVDYSKKSRDLFKIFGTWAAHMYNYEAMSSIEADSLNLIEVEQNKKSLVTDNFGNIIQENGQIKTADENDRNGKLLENFVNYYLYDKVNGKGTDKKIKAFGKEYSLLKSVSAIMRFFSLKTLALNPISGTANFVGGTGNALFMAEKGIFFTKKTWAQSMGLVAGNKKAQAALVYMNILQEGNKSQLINELSISNTNKLINTDNAFIIQRMSDKAVQYPVAIAMMMNHMVENGEIVDIQQFVKNKYNYNTTFYNLSESEQKSMRAKIDAEVKQLQDTKSLLAVGKLDEKTKEFDIPGIEKTSDTFIKFRSKIMGVTKKILGNNTREDINGIRTSLWGQAVMQFRNWMPEMAEERFAGLKYDDELQTWTYGKMNLFFSELFSKRAPMLLKSIITGFGTNAIAAAKESYYNRKREALEKGEDFTITEGEYIDLYLANIKSELTELMTILAFTSAILTIGTAAGDDEDESSGMKKYLARATRKYLAEFAFYYNPKEFTTLVNKPIPMIGLAEDMLAFTKAFSKEAIGQVVGSEEWTEEAKPAKYFFRMVPIAKEYILLQATFDDDFRKDWDIRIDAGFR